MADKDKFTYYSLDKAGKEKITNCLCRFLEEDLQVVFAYLHGSFVESQQFRDIDVAVYLYDEMTSMDRLEYELELEEKLTRKLKYPVDVRSINSSPPSFNYSVIKNGYKLVDKNEGIRVDFETMTLKRYFDFLPFRQKYFQEILND